MRTYENSVENVDRLLVACELIYMAHIIVIPLIMKLPVVRYSPEGAVFETFGSEVIITS